MQGESDRASRHTEQSASKSVADSATKVTIEDEHPEDFESRMRSTAAARLEQLNSEKETPAPLDAKNGSASKKFTSAIDPEMLTDKDATRKAASKI